MKSKRTYGAVFFFICMCLCVFKCSSFATLYNLTTSFIFKVYTAPNRVEHTLHTVDSSAETKITEVEQVDSIEELLYNAADIPCQPEETQELYVEKKVAKVDQVFTAEDSLRKKTSLSQETVTKDKIPEIKAEPITQAMQSEKKKMSKTSGILKEAEKLPDLVLKSDVSQTKPEIITKVVTPKEAVSMKVTPKENDIKMKKELKMSEIGNLTNTFKCAVFFTLSYSTLPNIHTLKALYTKCSLSCRTMLAK